MRSVQWHLEIYGWFVEEFSSPDLRQAQELLEELS